jgi:hypothetical protein
MRISAAGAGEELLSLLPCLEVAAVLVARAQVLRMRRPSRQQEQSGGDNCSSQHDARSGTLRMG